MPLSARLEPARGTAGMPGPKALAGRLESTTVCGHNISMPKSSELLGKALLVAGFQNREPVASMGAATAAPAIERLMGPAPVRTGPICARAGKALQANASKERAIALAIILRPRGMGQSLRNGLEKTY